MRRVALITGGSRGIGAACVRLFAENGYAAVFLYRSRDDKAHALVEELRAKGYDAACYRCDVSDGGQVKATVADILRLYHHIDVLVNNAGVAHIGLLTDMTENDWNAVFQTNIGGVFHVTQAALPGMISRQQGSIVNVSSMWGETGASCEVAYSAAKAAVIGFTKALAKEVGPSGVRVNCVSPGLIDTDMNAELDEAALRELAEETPLSRVGTAEEVARAVFYLAGDGASFITGQVLGVSGGLQI